MATEPFTALITDSWAPIDLSTLPDKPPIQPTLGNTQLIYPSKRHVFSGPPESAKTLAAYCILIQTVRQDETAILIDFEMGAYDARQRLQELGATNTELQRILYLEPDQRATPDRILNIIAYQPVLVVIDAAAGAYSLEGLDDNKRGDVDKIAHLYTEAFWRNGIATILIDHVVKNAQERGRFQIGSERKLGGTDVHIGFDTIKPISRGTTGHYKLIVHKDRGGYHKRGHLADFHLNSDPDTHQIEWKLTDPEPTTADAGYFRPTHLMEKVSIDLEHRPEPVTRTAVYEAIGGTKDYILKAISALVTEGFLTETDGPNRSKLVQHVSRYRENDASCNPENDSTGSVVRQWFGSGSRTRQSSCGLGGSSLRTTYVETTEPLAAADTTPEPHGWFGDNGHLIDSPDLDYLEQLKPDDDIPF